LGAEVQIASFLWLASEDLEAARLLATQQPQRGVPVLTGRGEKVIRAVLTAEGKHAGIRHLLDEMVDQVPDANPLKPALRAIQNLGSYATTYRYPTATGRILAAPTAGDLTKVPGGRCCAPSGDHRLRRSEIWGRRRCTSSWAAT
jgi:hypothetical protein